MTQNSEIEMVKTNLSKVVKTEIGKVEYQTLEDKFVVAKVWSEDHEVSGWADDLKVTKKDKPCETYLK
ncbi:MAG: hypothetical protein WCK90_03975, partial [archaeon]